MEFLIVHAMDRQTGDSPSGFPVLINGEANGLTCDLIKLDPGYIEVSIDAFLSETKQVELENTTYERPLVVVIPYGEPRDENDLNS